MLYAISGSQGCGKTTLLETLKKQYLYRVVDRKVSRSVQTEWGYTLDEINSDVGLTLRFQDEVLLRKTNDDVEAQQHHNEVWLTERSAADYFTYALVVLGKEPQCSDFLDQYYDRCKELQQIYDRVFYIVGGHFRVEQDVHRASSNKHYSRLIDLAMLDFTTQITDPNKLVIINAPSVEERVRIILDNM